MRVWAETSRGRWAKGEIKSFSAGSINKSGRWAGGAGKGFWESSACARVDAVSTKALGLEQKEHLKEEGNGSLSFRNI